MRLNRLDLNLLIALDALLSERSITRAAERIFLSQSATSGALSRLREFFGDEILVRVGAQMMLTPLGESLVAPVQNILLQIQSMVDRGLDFEPNHSDRKFRILCSDYAVNTIINPLVLHLAKVAPNVQLELFMPTNNLKETLDQGNVDFLLMPTYLLFDDHPKMSLFQEGFVCMGWNENPILTEGITEENFLKAKHVSVRFGPTRQRSQDQVLLETEFGVIPQVEIVTANFSVIPPMLVGTHRIAVCSERMAESWVRLLPLKTSPVPFDLPKISWGLQWHKFRELDPGIQWLQSQLSFIAGQLSK
jgi:LysR family nod box-dependent transcriptional activator|tara:strand:+ start:9592 stop:10506 length:915 start_codon:yes stop_codon:yes gene_type:complete